MHLRDTGAENQHLARSLLEPMYHGPILRYAEQLEADLGGLSGAGARL